MPNNIKNLSQKRKRFSLHFIDSWKIFPHYLINISGKLILDTWDYIYIYIKSYIEIIGIKSVASTESCISLRTGPHKKDIQVTLISLCLSRGWLSTIVPDRTIPVKKDPQQNELFFDPENLENVNGNTMIWYRARAICIGDAFLTILMMDEERFC